MSKNLTKAPGTEEIAQKLHPRYFDIESDRKFHFLVVRCSVLWGAIPFTFSLACNRFWDRPCRSVDRMPRGSRDKRLAAWFRCGGRAEIIRRAPDIWTIVVCRMFLGGHRWLVFCRGWFGHLFLGSPRFFCAALCFFQLGVVALCKALEVLGGSHTAAGGAMSSLFDLYGAERQLFLAKRFRPVPPKSCKAQPGDGCG